LTGVFNLIYENNYSIIFIDSINIDFDNKRRIVQDCNKKPLSFCVELEKNLGLVMIDKNLIKSKKGNLFFGYFEEYQIVFNMDDYNRAVDL
jgi:hypothetical protein